MSNNRSEGSIVVTADRIPLDQGGTALALEAFHVDTDTTLDVWVEAEDHGAALGLPKGFKAFQSTFTGQVRVFPFDPSPQFDAVGWLAAQMVDALTDDMELQHAVA